MYNIWRKKWSFKTRNKQTNPWFAKLNTNQQRASYEPTTIGDMIANAPGFIISLKDADATIAT